MDAVLSMRLHALVFSAGHGVPLIGAVYDPKVSSFLDCVGQTLYTPLEDLTFEVLRPQLDAAVALRYDRPRLEESVHTLRLLEQQNSLQAQKLLSAP